jgi:LAS superfamily LD-carboxypeptidase LdcB
MNIDILFGKTTEHLVPLEGTKFLLHQQMLHDFLKLQKAAKAAGFSLAIASAFRDYERQLMIWNNKACGIRPIYNDHEEVMDITQLTPKEIVYSILRFSALPGCSRHHWGTDIDVFDELTQKPEEVKLVSSECVGTGPAAGLHLWLDERIKHEEAFGFFRPYASDRGAIAEERWHLSYYPISRRLLDIFTFSVFRRMLEESQMQLKETVLEYADDIYHRYIMEIDLP